MHDEAEETKLNRYKKNKHRTIDSPKNITAYYGGLSVMSVP
jgi:hypothetical protein